MDGSQQQSPAAQPGLSPADSEKRVDVSTLAEPAKCFLQEEQKQRRTEIENLIGRIEGDQRYGLLATGIIWSWLFTNRTHVQPPFDLVVVSVPAIVILFFLWRWRALDASLMRMATYTRKLEEVFGLPEGCGWETYLLKIRGRNREHDELLWFAWGYWTLLIATNVALASLFVWFTRRSA